MALSQSKVLQSLSEVDEQLAADTREALKQRTDGNVREQLTKTLEQVRDALESEQKKSIEAAVRSLRTTVQLVISEGELSAKAKIIQGRRQPDAEENDFPRFPSPPNLTTEIAQAILREYKGEFRSRDMMNRKITVNMTTYEDSIGSLLRRIGYHVFGMRRGHSLGISYLKYLAKGESHEHAKALAKKEANERTAIIPLPNPPDITKEIASGFIAACKGRVITTDDEPKVFIACGVTFKDSPSNVLRRVSRTLFKTKKMAQSIVYLKLIARGIPHEKAVAEVESNLQNSNLPHLPITPHLTKSVAAAIIESCGGKLKMRETETVRISIDGIEYEDSPRNFLERIAYNVFQMSWITTQCIHYVEHIASGYPHEKAIELSLNNDAGISDFESEKLSEMNLEEVISFFSNQQGGEMKLKIYLQFAYPEMNQKEINKIVIRTFKNIYGGKTITREEEYLRWTGKLPPLEINRSYAVETKGNTLTLSGKAPKAECVHLCGTWSRRVKVEEDGTFRVTIPLKIGQQNDIRVMGIDRKGKRRSDQECISIKQTGKADDIDALVRLLENMNSELAAQIRVDPGRRKYLAECMERVVFKKFGQSFTQGEEYMKELQSRCKEGVVRDTIGRVLKKFQAIERKRLPNVKRDSEMFFQKYCSVRIRQAMDEGKTGINLCNDPGLGKTRTVWAAVGDQPTVVFTPNSVVSGWKTEASKCLIDPDLLVLDDSSHAVRKQKLRGKKERRMVTSTKFLQKVDDEERFDLVSDEEGIAVFDEAHSRKNEHSEQSKGARKVRHRFSINVTATLARNPVELRKMLYTLDPTKPEFKSDAAFRKAYPSDDPAALKSLKLLVDQYTIRFQKQEVMEEIDPDQELSKQLFKLPKKERVSPDTLGKFTMSERQAEAIYELFMDWPAWCKKYGKYIPDNEVNQEDGLRTRKGTGFAKLHAYRQIINNPKFIGDNTPVDNKAWQVERMMKQCIKEGRKPVLFCKYEAQALKYADVFKKYNPSSYTGQTSRKGVIKDANGKPKRFSVRDGKYFEDPKGQPMSMLDAECERFQNDPRCQLLIVTYGAGSVGTTFTAGKAMIYDDLPSDCKEDIQAEDRIHRIDPERQTKATVQYYQMQAKYPPKFFKRMEKKWIRRNTNDEGKIIPGWEEYQGEGKPHENIKNNPWITAYDAFFAQGTYDEVQSENLVNQRLVFHLINDGIGDEVELAKDQTPFFGLENDLDVSSNLRQCL